MSFISKDEDGGDYDPLDANTAYFKKKKYVYKEYSSSENVSEANFDEIEEEEFVSAMIGEKEDAEQLRILKLEE